jgi:3-oxoacyl-[acyl-carrier protein] reductase
MDLALSDKVVFVTGASGGIGRALARAFAAEGASLVLQGNQRWEGLVDWLAEQPWSERALPVQADVTDPIAMRTVLQAARERFGRVDVCLANAGVWPGEDRPLVELEEERVRRTLETNLLGSFWTARAFLEGLAEDGPRADGHGAVLLFTGSTAGRFGERGHADYAASKAGLVGLMLSLKNEIVELDPWARVNLIEPGWTVTEMTRARVRDPELVGRVVRTMPLRQLARAEDIARTAVVLASPYAARHTSGQVVTVAGGMEGRVLWEESQVEPEAVLRRLSEGE